MKKRTPLRIAVAMLLTLACTVANAATLTVTSNADSGAGTLRQAISDAADNDTINFNIVGSDTIVIASQLSILGKSLTINGTNQDSGNPITVQVTNPGASDWRVFYIDADGKTITISDMVIKGGNIAGIPEDGGGVALIDGTLNLNRVTVTGSNARHGGGVRTMQNNDCVLNLTDCTFCNNSADAGIGNGGGIILGSGTSATIVNSTFSGNSARAGGGINTSNANLHLVNSTLSGNAANFGGGLYVNGFYIHIANTIIVDNTAHNIYRPMSGVIYIYNSWYNNSIATIEPEKPTAPNLNTAYTAGDILVLADNGGPTQTMAIPVGKPAYRTGLYVYYNVIDGYYIQGTDNNYYKLNADYNQFVPADPASDKITTDQRGETRSSLPTIGAYDEAPKYYMAKVDGNWSAFGTVWFTNTTGGTDPGDYTIQADQSPTAENSAGIIVNADVTVDGNVTIDQTTVNAGKTLTVSDGVILTVADGDGVDLDIAGNWINDGTVACETDSTVHFSGANNSTLSGNGEATFSNLVLNKSGGTAATKLSVTSGATTWTQNLTLTQGTLDLSAFGHDLVISGDLVIGENGRWTKHGDPNRSVIFNGACSIKDTSSDGPQNLGVVKVDSLL
jgi:hypothetical protein